MENESTHQVQGRFAYAYALAAVTADPSLDTYENGKNNPFFRREFMVETVITPF